MKGMLLEITPGVHNPLFNIGSSVSCAREIVSRRLDLALAEGDRAPQFFLSNSNSPCSSQFFDAALTNTMPSHKTVLEECVDIQQSLGDRLYYLEYFHGIRNCEDVSFASLENCK
jgi:hypothetical protein